MYKRMVSHHSWDVPNSDIEVVLKKFVVFDNSLNASVCKKFQYVCGVAIKAKCCNEMGYSFFNSSGDEPFSAFENLMALTDRSVKKMFKILDLCNGCRGKEEEIPLSTLTRYWEFSKNGDNFPVTALSALENLNMDNVSIGMRKLVYECGSIKCACTIMDGDEDVFMAKPTLTKVDALANLYQAIAGAGALLEKFQGMAWNVMIDSSDPTYEIGKYVRANSLSMRKIEYACK